MNEKETAYSETVSEKSNKIIRKVQNIQEEEKILSVLSHLDMLGKDIVNTQILSQEENLLEHEYINGIIHSEEYTESMSYDIAKEELQLALKLLDNKIYSWDLLPHNFTFHNGQWILYDFDSISLKPSNIKTLVRGYFKIVFSTFELIQIIKRKDLKQCFLNRVKCSDLITMIPFKNWLKYFLRLNYSMLLLSCKKYKRTYQYLYEICSEYEKNLERKIYKFNNTQETQQLFDFINNIIKEYSPNRIFCIEELAANWALSTNCNLDKFIYLDNYDITDEIYNYIIQNKRKDITTGVLYPLSDDKDIKKEYKNRALYDSYAKKRFYSDCAILLNNTDIKTINELCDFSEKLLIIKTDTTNRNEILNFLKLRFQTVEVKEINNELIIIAINNIKPYNNDNNKNEYKNFNRGELAIEQTKLTKKLLK
ncbi:hypothetical protein IJ182_06570 [bacterium]|nr:hypothetical protein [bacterium]